ncbi:hypothetical protein HYH03_008042 [Edaphochlamys debaryana]|uniref:Uncharacterized protein n=1 Tax=Edaphochlamys debaryana TaxID=47281 RepID=A0A836BZW5_9CHLO|nr:hypothetical protein HYH03_008042 [Edaphochlamys debaryana]|eukprot:KAG2493824.1 hypothetical protein HYH03_008042 [Edaphochlamys debaryana]
MGILCCFSGGAKVKPEDLAADGTAVKSPSNAKLGADGVTPVDDATSRASSGTHGHGAPTTSTAPLPPLPAPASAPAGAPRFRQICSNFEGTEGFFSDAVLRTCYIPVPGTFKRVYLGLRFAAPPADDWRIEGVCVLITSPSAPLFVELREKGFTTGRSKLRRQQFANGRHVMEGLTAYEELRLDGASEGAVELGRVELLVADAAVSEMKNAASIARLHGWHGSLNFDKASKIVTNRGVDPVTKEIYLDLGNGDPALMLVDYDKGDCDIKLALPAGAPSTEQGVGYALAVRGEDVRKTTCTHAPPLAKLEGQFQISRIYELDDLEYGKLPNIEILRYSLSNTRIRPLDTLLVPAPEISTSGDLGAADAAPSHLADIDDLPGGAGLPALPTMGGAVSVHARLAPAMAAAAAAVAAQEPEISAAAGASSKSMAAKAAEGGAGGAAAAAAGRAAYQACCGRLAAVPGFLRDDKNRVAYIPLEGTGGVLTLAVRFRAKGGIDFKVLNTHRDPRVFVDVTLKGPTLSGVASLSADPSKPPRIKLRRQTWAEGHEVVPGLTAYEELRLDGWSGEEAELERVELLVADAQVASAINARTVVKAHGWVGQLSFQDACTTLRGTKGIDYEKEEIYLGVEGSDRVLLLIDYDDADADIKVAVLAGAATPEQGVGYDLNIRGRDLKRTSSHYHPPAPRLGGKFQVSRIYELDDLEYGTHKTIEILRYDLSNVRKHNLADALEGRP